jgi:hypothetical protein
LPFIGMAPRRIFVHDSGVERIHRSCKSRIHQSYQRHHRDAYATAFKKRIIRDCTTNAGGYLHSAVQLVGVRQLPSGDKLIGTRSEGSADGKILMWQVHPKEKGRLMVTDLLVDGRSAMLTLREEAGVAIERNDGDVAAAIGAVDR